MRYVRTDNDDRNGEAGRANCAKRALQTIDSRAGNARVQEVYRCITFSYGTKTERMDFVPPGIEGLEYSVTSIIKKMRDPERTIGFLTGHDEVTPENGMPYLSRFITEEHLGYTTRTVDLRAGAEDVPSDIKGLIIMQPTRQITEPELRRINGYLMRGGAVAIFASGITNSGRDINPTVVRAEHNLNALLEGYGVTLNADVVLDAQASPSLQEIEGQRLQLPMPIYPMVGARRDDDGPGIDTAHAAFFRLPFVNLPFVSTLTLNTSRARENGTRFSILARTSPRSVVQSGTFELDLEQILPRARTMFANERTPAVVGVAWEGQLRSAFSGAAPAAQGDAGAQAPAADNTPAHASNDRPARLLLVSSGRLFHIEQLGAVARVQPGGPPNLRLIQNTFDWLSQDADLLAVRAKNVAEPNLREVTDMKKNLFKWGHIIGLPLLAGLLGVAITRSRASARKALKL
ncbi:MAG: Gldg family protein [Polyangiales bacterium]